MGGQSHTGHVVSGSSQGLPVRMARPTGKAGVPVLGSGGVAQRRERACQPFGSWCAFDSHPQTRPWYCLGACLVRNTRRAPFLSGYPDMKRETLPFFPGFPGFFRDVTRGCLTVCPLRRPSLSTLHPVILRCNIGYPPLVAIFCAHDTDLLTQVYNRHPGGGRNNSRTIYSIYDIIQYFRQYLANENKPCTFVPHTAAWDSGGAVK